YVVPSLENFSVIGVQESTGDGLSVTAVLAVYPATAPAPERIEKSPVGAAVSPPHAPVGVGLGVGVAVGELPTVALEAEPVITMPLGVKNAATVTLRGRPVFTGVL